MPETAPEARIFLYEYDSTAVYSKDQSSFSEKANDLLEEIRIARRKGEATKPLILLGHSLGGILIKQALVNAHNNEKYISIKTAT